MVVFSASVLVRTIYDPGNRAVAIVGGILGFCLGLNNLLYDPGNRAVAMVGGVLGF